MPLRVPHGDCLNYGFIIDHESIGRLLFATDLTDFPYNVRGINTILLECNYIESLIVDKLCSGEDLRSASHTHMELSTCISVIRRLYSPRLMHVVLLHLSDRLSDITEIKRRFKDELGLNVSIAENNAAYSLPREEF